MEKKVSLTEIATSHSGEANPDFQKKKISLRDEKKESRSLLNEMVGRLSRE